MRDTKEQTVETQIVYSQTEQDNKNTSRRMGNRLQDFWVYLAMFAFYLLLFRLVCQSGLSADDMWNSNVWASPYTGINKPWDTFTGQIMTWLRLGRFFPFSNLATYIFVMCPTIVSYKLAIVVATYLDNLVCSLCLRTITGSKLAGYLYMLLFPVLIQLTPEYDSGLYCYHMLIQSVVLFCFLSLYGLVRYIDTDKKRYAVMSAICFLIALGIYEVAFVFIFVMIYVAYSRTKNFGKTIRYGLADGIVFGIMCLINIAARLFFKTGTYDGIDVQFHPVAVLVTLVKQCSTCIPLGRYICARLKYCYPYSDVYNYSVPDLLKELEVLDFVTILLFAGLLFYMIHRMKDKREEIKKSSGMLIVVGLLVFILPGVLIAISSKYQQMLGWCSGHLPAFMQSIGFAMLITGLFFALWSGIKGETGRRLLSVTCGILAAVIMLFSHVTGREAVEYMNSYRKYPQENVANAAKAGLFDDIVNNEDKVVFGTTSYIYDISTSRQFYSKFARANIYAVTRQNFYETVTDSETGAGYSEEVIDSVNYRLYDVDSLEKEYYGVFNIANKESGALIIGKCVQIDWDADAEAMRHVWIDNPKVYIRNDGLAIAGVDSSSWQEVKAGKDYTIYQLQGRYDILQNSGYYDTETEAGTLYYK